MQDEAYRRLKKMLEMHEGKSNFPYRCPAGKLTIGIGRNLEDKGIFDDEIDYLFRHDIAECVIDLGGLIKDFFKLDEVRQSVLIDMRFNLGPGGLRKFQKMLAAVNNRDFEKAAAEMKDSRWYHQVKDRAKRLCQMMATGKWWFEI